MRPVRGSGSGTHCRTPGVATLGTLFLSLVPGSGIRDALPVTLPAHPAAVVLTVLLSLRLPRKVA
ncbi:hypothetical protein [Streptomyces atratus]|uniref:hypothetical protein n=1 Tax=Streptomyces atratus TaxID=1893 RepID=UPI00365813C5